MFKAIVEFFTGKPSKAAEVQPQITDAVTTPSPQAESIKAAVEAKVADKAPAKKAPAKRTAAKKTSKPKQ